MTSQCTKPWASGSTTESASSAAAAGGAVQVVNGTSSAPAHVYSTGIAAPSSHGPENCSGVAPAAEVDEDAGDDDVDVVDELVDDVEVGDGVVDDVEVGDGVVDVAGTTSGGAVVVVVDVDVVVWLSR
jgi:hypothetical protein